VEPPTNPAVEPWQHSDSGTEKFFGNVRHSDPRSFWTGVSPTGFGTATEPENFQSVLTMKNPISVPAQGDPQLSWRSLFKNDANHLGTVQVALTTGSTPPDQLDWETVDQVDEFVDQNGADDGACTTPLDSTDMQARSADLGGYKGKQILVRFVYTGGAEQYVNAFPCGWYVDDIGIFTGTWTQIGTSKEPSFAVTNKPNGTYGYRIKGIYNDGVATAPSNVESAVVTNSSSLPDAELARCLKQKGNIILGSAGKDTLVGTTGRDVLCGFHGNDRINGKGGPDSIFGGGGNDALRGSGGKDLIRGEKGKDVLSGGKGNDRLKGGKKRDILKGGPGNDKCGNKAEDVRRQC
jgi:Ca2+-binding RTX toxin-like protein